MKKTYPRYALGELERKDKALSKKNKEILDDFIELCSITAKGKKLEKIRRNLVQFYDITELDFNKQTKKSVDKFLSLLNDSDRSIWTKNEVKVYVRKFLNSHYKDLELIENIKTSSRRGLDPVKINENNLITEEDVEKMLRFAQNYKEKAYLFLIFESGARPQELSELKWKDIKFEDKYANITLYSKKTNQSRTFPVKKAKEHLFNWKENYSYLDVQSKDYVFPSRWRDKPITSVGLNVMLRRMAKASELKKDVWSYLFRHSRATKLYEELPTPIVEKLMGHKNMSGIYAHISSKKAREEMLNKIYNIEELSSKDKNQIEELQREMNRIKEYIKKNIEIQNKISKDRINLELQYDKEMPKEIKEKYLKLKNKFR